MSLPSRAIFKLHNGETVSAFCNIGWFYDESNIPRTVAEAMENAKLEQSDWHTVTLYGETYTKKDLNAIMRFYKIMSYDEFVKEQSLTYTDDEIKRLTELFNSKYNVSFTEKLESYLKEEYDNYRKDKREQFKNGWRYYDNETRENI